MLYMQVKKVVCCDHKLTRQRQTSVTCSMTTTRVSFKYWGL